MASRRPRYLAPLVVLATLVGLWIAHTLEIWQLTVSGVQFSGSVSLSPFGGVHNYMVLVGVALLVLSAVFGRALWRIWDGFCAQIEIGRRQFRRLLRTGDMSLNRGHYDVAPTTRTRLLSLWLPITAAQILLYVFQENIESAAAGRALPGITVLFGLHWAAPLIHGAVALLLSTLILLATWKIHGKATALARIVRSHNALWQRLSRAPSKLALPRVSDLVTGLSERLGTDIWQRPPPVGA